MPSALTSLEIASGTIRGGDTEQPPPPIAHAISPVLALEQALLPALERTPCLVSFSGGKDSSFLLALAVDVARREGLPLPVPITWRFSHAPRADESQWQNEIIDALRLREWEILTAGDDLDIVAPLARKLLRAYGVRYPANLHLHEPIAAAASGGSVITGLGGDQVLTCWWQPGAGQSARTRTRARLLQLAPKAVRAAGRPRQARAERPWLRPRVAGALHRDERMEAISEPRHPAERLAWRSARRHLLLTMASCTELASAHDVEIHHPLMDKEFHAALAAVVPATGSYRRSELIAEIGGDRVPPVVYRRTTKAWFGDVFIAGPSHAFAAGWDGAGADEDLVDARVLRKLWSTSPVPNGTALLLQQLWLQQDQAAREVTT